MRAEGANLSCAQLFSLGAKPQNEQEGVSAPGEPWQYESTGVGRSQEGIHLLRHKGPKE